jgi:hypothetical protein
MKNFRGKGHTQINAPIDGFLLRAKIGDILIKDTQSGNIYNFFRALRQFHKDGTYGKPIRVLEID